MELTKTLQAENLQRVMIYHLSNYISNYFPRFKLIDMHPINLNGGGESFFKEFAEKKGYDEGELISFVEKVYHTGIGFSNDERIDLFNKVVMNNLNGSDKNLLGNLRNYHYNYVGNLDLKGEFSLLFHFDRKKRSAFLNHFSELSYNGIHHIVDDLIRVADLVDERFETVKEKSSAFATYIRNPEVEGEKYFSVQPRLSMSR